MKLLRRGKGNKKLDKYWNEDIRQELNIYSVNEKRN